MVSGTVNVVSHLGSSSLLLCFSHNMALCLLFFLLSFLFLVLNHDRLTELMSSAFSCYFSLVIVAASA